MRGKKGGKTRLRLRQVPPALKRILLRAKRKPTPSIQAARSRRGTVAGCWQAEEELDIELPERVHGGVPALGVGGSWDLFVIVMFF